MKDYSTYYPSQNNHILTGGQFIFDRQLMSLEGKDVLINSSTTPIRCLIQKSFNRFNEKKYELELVCKHNIDIKSGDYVKYTDELLNNETYLTITKPDVNAISKQMLIIDCNSKYVWNIDNNIRYDVGNLYDNDLYYDTDGIHSYDCIIKTSTSIGLDENNPFDLNSKELVITMQLNGITNTIIIGSRVIFGDKRTFKVYNIDDYSNEGLLVLYLQADAFNPTTDKRVEIDGVKYWIANYINIQVPEQTGSEIIITPNVDIVKKTTTSGIDFTATKYTNGVVVPSTFTFTIDSDSTGISGTDYVFTVVDSDTFNVKSLSMNKYVNVKIQDNSSALFVVKKINLLKY